MTAHHDVLERLGKATADVKAARTRLREEQEAAWQRYVASVNAALADDLDLSSPAAGGAGDAGEPDPVHELLDAIRGRVDDLRVQAQLGRMEAAEVLEHLQDSLGSVVDRLTR